MRTIKVQNFDYPSINELEINFFVHNVQKYYSFRKINDLKITISGYVDKTMFFCAVEQNFFSISPTFKIRL